MNAARRPIVWAMALVLLGGPSALGSEGWSVQDLWPFGRASSETQKKKGSPLRPVGWSGSGSASRDEPSVFARVTSGPRALWNRAAQVLRPDGGRAGSPAASSSPKRRRGGLFGFPERREGSKTMNEFLSKRRLDL